MPADQRVGLNDVQGLLPELGAASQQYQTKTVVVGQLGPFDLAVENNELLAQHSVLGDEVGLAAGHISQRGGDEGHRGWFSPLFDPATEVFAEVEKGFEHVGMVSPFSIREYSLTLDVNELFAWMDGVW